MNIDSVQIIDTICNASTLNSEQTTSCSNLWMWIAIVELVIIIVLISKLLNKENTRTNIKKKVLREGDIDFANIIDSSFNSEQLYKELIRKCHPDRFVPNKAKVKIAEDISSRLGKNKHNIKGLKELAEEAKDKLNINI
jgi:hypothetical protein